MIPRLLILLVLLASLGTSPFAQGARGGSQAVDVFKTPDCGCCAKWVDHMKASGYEVRFVNMPREELDKVKGKHGVPAPLHSCHTALAGGYVLEGHMPASEVKRLLKKRPKVVGLAVPGMPLGSPGMEVTRVKPQPYDVLTFDKQGKTQVYSTQKP